jgi:hypothetical protein
MKRLAGIIFILVTVAAPVAAQDPHVAIITAAKAAAVAAGVDVDNGDECQRFEITTRAAVLLAGEGAGLLEKTGGNRCRDRSVDIIAYPSGRIFDIIGAGQDGANTPHWIELTPVNPERWRAPFDILAPTPTPEPGADEPPAVVEHDETDLQQITAQLTAIRAEFADLQAAEHLEHEQTRADLRAFREAAKKATSKFLAFVPSILSALGLLKP